MRTLLCALAAGVHAAMSLLGPGTILCIGVDGHVALEDGTASCCRPGEGSAVAKIAEPDTCCAPLELDDAAEPPCPGCRDIPLGLASDDVLRDPQQPRCGLPAPASCAAGWTIPPPSAAVIWPAAAATPPGWRALADLRTVVQRR